MARCPSLSRRLYANVAWLLVLTLALTGCALGLPGSKSSATPAKQSPTATPLGTIKEFGLGVSGGILNITVSRDGDLWFPELTNPSLDRMSPAGQLTKISLATNDRQIGYLVPGPDGNLWFIGQPHTVGKGIPDSIGYFTPAGQMKEYLFPVSSTLSGLVSGANRGMWYSREDVTISGTTFSIGQISPSGSKQEYHVPVSNGRIMGLDANADGSIWFTFARYSPAQDGQISKPTGGAIGHVTSSGHVQLFWLPSTGQFPTGIWSGSAGDAWFRIADANGDYQDVRIGHIDKNGKMTETQAQLDYFVQGPDGAMWFTDKTHNAIGRFKSLGKVIEFPVPTAKAGLTSIVTGGDKNLWFAEENTGKIGRITPSGEITEFSIPTSDAHPLQLAVGADGNLWFAEYFGELNSGAIVGDIGRVTV